MRFHIKTKNRNEQGFTLVELLVSIAIFAVLSALGWKVFDYLVKVRDRNELHEQNLSQLQDAYLQFQKDSLQIVPLTANINNQIRPALELENSQLRFSKAGVTDPLKQGISPYERIEYQYNAQDKTLYRLKYPNLNVSNNAQPLSSVILSQVEQFEMTVLNPSEVTRWPENGVNSEDLKVLRLLPKGFRVKFMIQEIEYEWLFSLINTDNLEEKKSDDN